MAAEEVNSDGTIETIPDLTRQNQIETALACRDYKEKVKAREEVRAAHELVETLRRAGRLQSDLRYGRIDEILATGLHALSLIHISEPTRPY